jgi:hypothetical protein
MNKYNNWLETTDFSERYPYYECFKNEDGKTTNLTYYSVALNNKERDVLFDLIDSVSDDNDDTKKRIKI